MSFVVSGRHPRGQGWGGGAFIASGVARGRAGARALAGTAVVAAAVLAGCNLNQEGVRPPANRIFFPGGAVIESAGAGAGKWLYVVNSNSDLRYNAGTVVAVNLTRVRQDYPVDPALVDAAGQPRAWGDCRADSRWVPAANLAADERCCWDFLDSNILNCDEQVYVRRESSVRIGNFGGRPVLQQLPSPAEGGSGRRRMFLPVRGDASIGMLDVQTTPDAALLSCTGDRSAPAESDGQFPVCEPQWQITRGPQSISNPLPDNEVLRLPDEPYALAVDEKLRLLYVGHLRGGSVSMVDLGRGTEQRTPELVQTYPNLLPGDANGAQGVTSLTVRDPQGGCLGPIYASSRFVPLVGSFVVYGAECQGAPEASSARGIALVGTGQFLRTGLTGTETRGIEFVRTAAGQEPERAFILQKTPPALVAVDSGTLLSFATIEVCQSPTNLVQQTDAAGRTVALFVTCFDAGELYVIDPWVPRLRAIVPVGRGPVATILPPAGAAAEDAARAYVVGFGANNISVVDLDPESPRQYRVIQRIGFSSPTPREVGPQ